LSTDAATITLLNAEDEGVKLSVGIDGSSRRLMIKTAEHHGARSAVETRTLDALCALVVGRPLQEAADHGAIYAMAALPNDCRKVDGIPTPTNAGAHFVLAQRLIRGIHAAARAKFQIGHRDNAWYLRPKADWLAMTELQQAEQVKPIIAAFLRENGLSEQDAWVSRIERGTRLTIAFSDGVSYSRKPALLMALETKLRGQTGDPLELFMDEMKDANKIRRL
jgi:hypothetical protein